MSVLDRQAAAAGVRLLRIDAPVDLGPGELLRMVALSFLGTNLAQVGYYELGAKHARKKAY